MSDIPDIRGLPIYRQGVQEGLEKGLKKGLETAIEMAMARLAVRRIAVTDVTAMLERSAALVQQIIPSVRLEPVGDSGRGLIRDIRHTRVYQEAVEEGMEKGIATIERMGFERKIASVVDQAFEQGVKTCAAFLIAKLTAKKMPATEIAATLEVDIALVRQVIEGAASDKSA
jgi:flagellar biosynthesis/type III secretory pathway protein FliH